MRNAILAMLVAALIAALPAQTASASERHHAQTTKSRAVAIEQFRESHAYAPPTDIAVQPGWSGYSRYSGYDGALGAGIAGH